MLIAASTVAAFRSGIFISAISRTLSLEIVATFVLFGTPEPDFRLQAFLSRTAAGGVLVMKLKLLSAYTVITTGMIRSPLSAVLALNSLVNCTMFTPCCPSAGPTGGAGVALPAGICNLIYPVTFFAILRHLLNKCGNCGNFPPTKRPWGISYIFLTSAKLISTGVSRPNSSTLMVTICFVSLIL